MAEPKVEITYKDDNEAYFQFTVSGLDPSTGGYFDWWIESGTDYQISQKQFVNVDKGQDTWTSNIQYGYYPPHGIGEHPLFCNFQHELVYAVVIILYTGDYNSFGDKLPSYLRAEFQFDANFKGMPYVTDLTYKQLPYSENDIEITCTFNTVDPFASEIGAIGTKFELWLQSEGQEAVRNIVGYFHEAIQNGNWNPPLDGWSAVQHEGSDNQIYDVKWRMTVSHGDKIIIRLSNEYYDQETGKKVVLGPSTSVIDVNLLSATKPFITYSYLQQADYSYDGGRVSGIINGAISIKTEDWNSFIAVLQQYYDNSGIDWDIIKAKKGEGLTAERWNAVIRTLKQYYEANGYLLDDRIQEVQKGQRIYPEMIMRVNHAFNI